MPSMLKRRTLAKLDDVCEGEDEVKAKGRNTYQSLMPMTNRKQMQVHIWLT